MAIQTFVNGPWEGARRGGEVCEVPVGTSNKA
jgi:hypothetical protein